MCVSTGPAEFNRTKIASWDDPDRSGRRVLTYANTAQSYGERRRGIASEGPNAMIFPIHGGDVGVLEVADPKASRDWLMGRTALYHEMWTSAPPMPALLAGGSRTSIISAGNYQVGVADSIEAVPDVLGDLKRVAANPGDVPNAPDDTLQWMIDHYREEGLGMPAIVIAVLGLKASIEDKNPITVEFTPFDSLNGKVVFPALDYHGVGPFESTTNRDHILLVDVPGAAGEIANQSVQQRGERPREFGSAPERFGISIFDKRRETRPDGGAWFSPEINSAKAAPNNDYIVDVAALSDKLSGLQVGMTPEEAGQYAKDTLAADSVIRFSNQLNDGPDSLEEVLPLIESW